MPSPIGHALGGVAVVWMADLMPAGPPASPRLTVACAGLAALPDVDLLLGFVLPVTHRTVTHSLGAVVVVGLVMIVAAAVTGKVTPRMASIGMAAYASHLLLDWLQADPTPPYGLQALWPISSTWFISGWTIFRATDRRHWLELATIKRNVVAVGQEIAILAPILAALWLARLVRIKTLARLATEMSRGHHPPQ